MYRNQRATAREVWGNEEKTVQDEYQKTKIKTEAEEIHHCDDPYLPEDDATPFEELIEADAEGRTRIRGGIYRQQLAGSADST